MGKDFAENLPTAKAWFDRANSALGYDLASICFAGPEAELTKTENAQPGIFLVSWVAFQLLNERVPSLNFGATAGLSLGEFTALTAAGAMSFEDGLKLVRQRGRFMQEACEVTRGGMAAIIGLDEAPTREVCAQAGVALANLNCPGQLVISGETEKIAKACELAQAKGARRALPLTVGPFRRVFQLEKHLAGFGHEQNAFVLTIREIFGADGVRIAVAEIDLPASLLGDLRGERDLDAAFFDAVFKCADAAHVRRMREHAPRNIFELVPLLQKIIPAMVADLVDVVAVADTHLLQVRRVNDQVRRRRPAPARAYTCICPRPKARHTSAARRRGWCGTVCLCR